MIKYRLGKIAGILAKNSQGYDCLGFDDVAITLSSRKSTDVHSYDHILGNIQIKKGILFFALEWKEVNGERIKFDWLSPKIASPLQSQINIKIDAFYKRYFSESAKVIVDTYQNLESLYKQDRYLRYSSTQEWLENNRKLQGILVREERAKYLDKKTNDYANELNYFYENTEDVRAQRNKYYIKQQCVSYGEYFDRIESNPLTESQRKACVMDEDANLVLAGAGTGKTSTMVGKAGYLVESGLAGPEQILMLAFARKAAEEMQERIEKRTGIDGLTVKTFHSLGKSIIAEIEGKQASLTKMAEDEAARVKFVDDTLVDLLKSETYRIKLFNYFANYLYPVKNIFDFKSKKEYIEFCQQVEPRSLNGDLVRSHEELIIANYTRRAKRPPL